MNILIPQSIQVPIEIVIIIIIVFSIITIIAVLANFPQTYSKFKLLFSFGIGILLSSLIHEIHAPEQLIFVLQATLTGAAGGLLYSMQSRKLERPLINNSTINPGFLVDCCTGIAGAYIVFLLIPGDYDSNTEDITYLIKILALGLIGGYAGRNLLDVAVEGILRQKVDVIGQQVDVIEHQVDVIETKADQNQTQIQENNEAKALLDIHFGRFEGLNSEELEKLNDSLKVALPEVRTQARLQAQNICEEAEKTLKQAKEEQNQEVINKNEALIQRAIQVFEILIAIDRANPIPNTYGQLGYALKIVSSWDKAESEFTNAIKIIHDKEPDKLSETDKAIQKWCEYQRAICRIELGKITGAEIDIRSANQDQKLAERIKNRPLAKVSRRSSVHSCKDRQLS
jgi:tetratricopeptide (TPR) repeat protein